MLLMPMIEIMLQRVTIDAVHAIDVDLHELLNIVDIDLHDHYTIVDNADSDHHHCEC